MEIFQYWTHFKDVKIFLSFASSGRFDLVYTKNNGQTTISLVQGIEC